MNARHRTAQRFAGLTLGLVLAATLATTLHAQDTERYRDRHLAPEVRADDLLGRMTLAEKVSQLTDHSPAIARLHVPAYDWWNEGLHGSAFAGYSTVFPQAIGLAATWDAGLMYRLGDAVSLEARAKADLARAEGRQERFFGLTIWAPNINIFRDPRWGRGQETYGEDPYLTGQMAAAYARGLQGDDLQSPRVVSTAKHFAIHSGPEATRHQFNVAVSPHDLEATYLPAFRTLVQQGHVSSVMCAYNAIDGKPACGNTDLLEHHLRSEWGFTGYVVSDCGAVLDFVEGHRFAPDLATAAADALKAGTDLECGIDGKSAFTALIEAVQRKLVAESTIDRSLRRLLTARFRLGLFDPPPPAGLSGGRLTQGLQDHRGLALRAAEESMVLLKNANGTLPLRIGLKTIAVVGPNADLVQSLQGNYNGTPIDPVTPLRGLTMAYPKATIRYAQGSTLVAGFPVPIEATALRSPDGRSEGLAGVYFAAPDWQGRPAARRVDRKINFNWDKIAPADGLKPERFSVRWSGRLTVPATGEYRLGVRYGTCYACSRDEQVRLYLDGRLIVGQGPAQGQAGSLDSAPIKLGRGETHTIRLDYAHSGDGGGGVDLVWQAPAEGLRQEAVEAARNADVVLAFLGLSPGLEGEEMPVNLEGFQHGDRTSIDLPRIQEQLLEGLHQTGRPIVLILQNGSALAIGWAKEHVPAILEAWYPGVEGGTAIARTLQGSNNPAGRLPVTFYQSTGQLPPFEDYSMMDRTYRYFEGPVLYPFGFGLSYAKIAYTRPQSLGDADSSEGLTLRAEVENTGTVGSDELVQLYLRPPHATGSPARMLIGFRRIHLDPGEKQEVRFTVKAGDLHQIDEKGKAVFVPGTYKFWINGGLGFADAEAAGVTLLQR